MPRYELRHEVLRDGHPGRACEGMSRCL